MLMAFAAADAEKWTYCAVQGGFDFVATPINSDKVFASFFSVAYIIL